MQNPTRALSAAHRVARALDRLEARPIVVVTHKRSGTHLLLDTLRRQYRECDAWKWWGENHNRLYLALGALWDPTALAPIGERGALGVLRRCPRPAVKTHEFPAEVPAGDVTGDGRLGRYWIDWLERRGRMLYVYRDGRDVLCSLQLLEAKRDRRRWRPLSEFIRQTDESGRSRVALWARHVELGLAREDAVRLRFEDLLADPRRVIAELAGRLELTPLDREPPLPRRHRSLWHSRWSRLVERRPESSAILGRPPGFELARWRRDFSREDREFFHREAGETLVRLGYEDSDAWVDG